MVRRLRESMDPRNLRPLGHLLDLLRIGFRSMQISVRIKLPAAPTDATEGCVIPLKSAHTMTDTDDPRMERRNTRKCSRVISAKRMGNDPTAAGGGV